MLRSAAGHSHVETFISEEVRILAFPGDGAVSGEFALSYVVQDGDIGRGPFAAYPAALALARTLIPRASVDRRKFRRVGGKVVIANG